MYTVAARKPFTYKDFTPIRLIFSKYIRPIGSLTFLSSKDKRKIIY